MPTIRYRQIIVFFCCACLVAIVYSPFVLSVAMISLVVLSVFPLEIVRGMPRFTVNKAGLQRMKNVKKYPVFWAITLFFFLAAIRFYPLGDEGYYFERLRIKMPFLVLPLAFLGLPAFSNLTVKRLLYFFFGVMVLTSVGILVNYLADYEHYNELIKQGRSIPTPRNHIRYSLLAAWAVILGIYLRSEKVVFRYRWESWLQVGGVLFLIVFLHLLSVKSGLLLLYVILFVAVLQYIWHRKSWLLGGAMLLGVIALPVIAYQTVPSFKNKITYFEYDLYMFNRGEGAKYSDSGRIVSLQAGWEIAKDNWLWGVGTANLRQEVSDIFAAKYADYPEVFMPQNQFLFSWAATGIFGMLLVIFAFFYPLLAHRNYRHWIYLNFYASIFVIITIEHAFENAIGVAHYLFFLLLFLSSVGFGLKKAEVDR